MNGKRNYQKELDRIILDNQNVGKMPTLLLHSCCAPCSSYCLEYLSQYFNITVLYYNPNITNDEEYEHRVKEQRRLIACLNDNLGCHIEFCEGRYEPGRFLDAVKGYEACKEGEERCKICFAIRLDEAAKLAKDKGFDYFTTTLTISPLKNAEVLNEIGENLAKKYEVNYLPSDFKKRNGYKRSIELSKEYDLYRQNYCGCEFSKRDASD